MREGILFKSVAGGIVAFCSFLFGGIDIAFQTLIFFLVADFITGTYKAMKNRELSSRKSWDGFGKKIMTLLVVALAVRIDVMMNANGSVRLIAMYGYIGTELYSITENIIAVGVPVPETLAKYFKKYSEELRDYEK